MVNRKALGRGLKALIPDAPSSQDPYLSGNPIEYAEVDKITPNPFQPRETFDPEKLEELKNSIAEKGLVQPITIRRHGYGYQLISGERRLRAVRDLGIERIPAYVLDVQTDEEMLELSIIENIHREDLNPIEVANGYHRLIEECQLTQEEVAKKLGKDRTTVTNFLRLLKLPKQIQDSVQHGEVSMGHARALLSIPGREEQINLWKKIIRNGLSVRSIEKLVREQLQTPAQIKSVPSLDKRSIYHEDIENRLRKKLTTKVQIKAKQKGGAIEIDYYSDDDLDRLIAIICD
jgi:ParB family transcriptional regulator, chromosome partitioning protein